MRPLVVEVDRKLASFIAQVGREKFPDKLIRTARGMSYILEAP